METQNQFCHACCNGNLREAQRLYHISVETDSIEKKDDNAHSMGNPINIHAFFERAFRGASLYGHLDVAQWLYHVSFEMKDTVDIHADNECAFRWACSYGHLEVAQWLYDLSVDTDNTINIHADNEGAFRYACSNGHLDVAQWLYHISSNDDLKETYASANAQTHSMDSNDSKDTVDIHALDECAFRWACAYDHLDVAQWLYQLSVTTDKLMNIHARIASLDKLHHLCVEQNQSQLNTNRFFRLFIDKL